MNKKIMIYKSRLLFMVIALLMLFSCDKPEFGSPVNAAINIKIDQVKSSSVSVNINSRQDNVVAYLLTSPIRMDEVNYEDMTVVEKYDFIKERGQKITQVPHEFKALDKLTAYFVGAMGLDKSGNVVTAPIIMEFSTLDIAMETKLSFEEVSGGVYKYLAEVNPNISTEYYDYIFDVESAGLSNAELQDLLKSNSSYVKRAEGTQNFTFEKSEKGTAVFAAIPYDVDGVPGNLVVAYVSSETLVTVDYNGAILMEKPDDDKEIYEVRFQALINADFTISINSEQYGFLPYSGNGGVGKTGVFSAFPSFNVNNAALTYYVSKSIGRMSKITQGGKPFFVNTTAPVEVMVRVDMTYADGIPRYYFEVVNNDPSVILHETFDLFAYSGDYMAPANGTEVSLNPDVVDGTEPGVKQAFDLTNAAGANKNEIAYNRSVFDWPILTTPTASNKFLAAESYIKNRGMHDWTLQACGERPGAIQLSVGGNLYGVLTTPKLTAINGTSDITLEIDMARFSTSSRRAIAIDILGGGQYASGEVTVDGKTKKVLTPNGDRFLVNADADVCPPSESNGAINKPVSHFKFRIAGATSNTQIRIDTSVEANGTNSAETRAFVFEIKVTK